MSTGIIGGADGPTAIFIAGKFEPGWLNIFGLVIVILMLIPNIVYAKKFKGCVNKCLNKGMNTLEQTGRYSSMAFMILNEGTAGFGFSSVEKFVAYLIGNVLLLVVYEVIWVLYFKEQGFWKGMALAVIPICIFLLCAITLNHRLLLLSAILFGVVHIYVICQNER